MKVINKTRIFILMAFSLFSCLPLHAQVFALKSNLAADAVASPNLGTELKLGRRLSLDIAAHYNPFSNGMHRSKHWLVQPELRFWQCQPFSGHFWGMHILAGEYNIGNMVLPLGLYRGTRSWRYEGRVMGAGLSYGYQWIISPRWGIETEIGAGWVRASYTRYRCAHCGEQTGSGYKYYLGPTKVAVSLVYLLK